MTVVSSKEFLSNEDKYFDMAVNEELCIKKDNNMFYLIYKSSDNAFKSKSRQDWAECARKFIASGNEETFFPDFFEDEDLNWWQWKQE